MNTKTFGTLGLCLRETFCQPHEIEHVCVNGLGNLQYVSGPDLRAALAGAALIQGQAAAFRGMAHGLRYFVLQRLNNGDYLYQERTVVQENGKPQTNVFSMLFDDEARGRRHLQRATTRHLDGAGPAGLCDWRAIPFPGLAVVNGPCPDNEGRPSRVLH